MTSPTTRHRVRRTLAILVCAVGVSAAVLAPATFAASPSASSVDPADQILVRFPAGTTAAQKQAVAADHGLVPLTAAGVPASDLAAEPAGPTGQTELAVAPGRSPAAARRQLAADPRVEAVAGNFRRELAIDPKNEPAFGAEWGLDNHGQEIDGITDTKGTSDVDIDGLQALRLTIGSPSTVVAVIDDGVDFSHPDLAARAWTNPGEAGAKANNGIDDDHNGYIDDVHGWDFCHDDNTVHDVNGDFHGTHVAGTIAASLNGQGVVGVAPGVTIMALKFIDDNADCGTDQMAVDALDYAASFGVHLINASWGGPEPSAVLDSAIADSGALLVAAAGNSGADMDAAGAVRFYPAASTLSNIVSVGAVDQNGKLASFSDYGKTSVDLVAPGTNILSTYVPNTACGTVCYAFLAGTSMATPHVTGTAALVGSGNATLLANPTALKARLLATGKPLPATTGKTVTGKIVDAVRAIDVWPPVAKTPDRFTVPVGTIIGATSVKTLVSWPPATDIGSGVARYQLRRHDASGFTTVVTESKPTTATSTLRYAHDYTFELGARDYTPNNSAPVTTPSLRVSLHQSGSSLSTYDSKWSSVAQMGASLGHVNTATAAGATMSFTFSGRSVAIVAPKGASRGSAKVYVDGVFKTTVDLHASSTVAQGVVYSLGWSTSQRHTVKVVVVGTAGHPRVDLDAFVVVR